MAHSTHNTDYQLLLGVLRATPQQQGVSQVELAARLGNTQTFISKCERGERRIDVVELVEFAEALGVAPLELISDFLSQRRRKASPKTRRAKVSAR